MIKLPLSTVGSNTYRNWEANVSRGATDKSVPASPAVMASCWLSAFPLKLRQSVCICYVVLIKQTFLSWLSGKLKDYSGSTRQPFHTPSFSLVCFPANVRESKSSRDQYIQLKRSAEEAQAIIVTRRMRRVFPLKRVHVRSPFNGIFFFWKFFPQCPQRASLRPLTAPIHGDFWACFLQTKILHYFSYTKASCFHQCELDE